MLKQIILFVLTFVIASTFSKNADIMDVPLLYLHSPLPNVEKFQAQLNESLFASIENMEMYHNYMKNLSDAILDQHKGSINEKVAKLKNTAERSSIGSSVVSNCLNSQGQLDALATLANEQIQKCATIVLSEMVNVITDSLNEAQTFMTIPTKLAIDVQLCGLSRDCLWKITNDAFAEAVQVPPKIFSLSAKIQSITLRTVVNIDSCGVDGLKTVAEAGIEILEDVFSCIADEIDVITQSTTTSDHVTYN